jgi:hypothetical protein
MGAEAVTDHRVIPAPDSRGVIWYADGARIVLDHYGQADAYRADGLQICDRRFSGKFRSREKAAAALWRDAQERQREVGT